MKPTNVHTHLFCLSDVPTDFLPLYMDSKRMAAIVNKLIRSRASWAILWAVKLLYYRNPMVQRYIRIVEAGRYNDASHMHDLLRQNYDSQDFRFVALTLNLDHIGGGNAQIFNGQLESAIAAKKKAANPHDILLFLGLDPRGYSSGDEMLKDVVSRFDTKIPNTNLQPFAGLKIYPSTGYFPFDEKLKPTFMWAADNGIPIISHNYYLGGVFLNSQSAIESAFAKAWNPYSKNADGTYGAPYEGPVYDGRGAKANSRQANQRASSYFMEPECYREMLAWFHDVYQKPLKICFAHFGGIHQMRLHSETSNSSSGITDELETKPIGVGMQLDRTKPDSIRNWHSQILYLLKNFSGTYADISYMTSEFDYEKAKYWQLLLRYMANQLLTESILFGTDFYLAERGKSTEKEVYQSFRKAADNAQLDSGVSMWEQLAYRNVNAFLKSAYVP